MSDITQSKKSAYVAAELSEQIKAGVFGKSGQRFMSVRRLAEEKGISLVTAQKVLTILRERGLVEVLGNYSYITTGRISAKSPLYKAMRAKENPQNKSSLIGIHVPEISNLFFAAFLKRSVTAIRNHGYMPVIMCSDKNPDSERQILKDFIAMGAAGIISFSGDDNKLKDVYKNYILPAVFEEDRIEPAVAKNKMISRRIADYLLEMGYENFIYVGFDLPDSVDVRRTAYVEELSSHGYTLGKDDIFFLKDDGEYNIPYVLKQKIKNSPKPLGIFCYHDLIAAQILLVCNRLGIRVPEDVGIVGFDNWPVSKQLKPTLTTVSYSFKKMAESAVERLIYSIENDKDIVPDSNDDMDYVLHMRQSTKRKLV